MFIPPTTSQPLPVTALAGSQPAAKQPRGDHQVRPQTRAAVEASERSEDSQRRPGQEGSRGARLDISV